MDTLHFGIIINCLSFLGKTVTSEDFDVRLMICLLRAFINLRVRDEKPVKSDTNIIGMLSIINNIRNEIIRKYDGKLLETQFNQYWECIGRVTIISNGHNNFWLSLRVFLRSNYLVLYNNKKEEIGGKHF